MAQPSSLIKFEANRSMSSWKKIRHTNLFYYFIYVECRCYQNRLVDEGFVNTNWVTLFDRIVCLIVVGRFWPFWFELTSNWTFLTLIDLDWPWLTLIDLDWPWLTLIDFDWPWLTLIGPDWPWSTFVTYFCNLVDGCWQDGLSTIMLLHYIQTVLHNNIFFRRLL